MLPELKKLPRCRQTIEGWQLHAGWRTGTQEPGRPEGLPRTATIDQIADEKKAPATW